MTSLKSPSASPPDFWSGLPTEARHIFRTDPQSGPYWRPLLACDPVATFVLDQVTGLPELLHFLEQNRKSLCAGFLSYDLGMELLGVRSRHLSPIPLAVFHAYADWFEELPGSSGTPPVHCPLEFTPEIDKPGYRMAFERIHQYIRAGDFYQLNLTTRLLGTSATPSRDLYRDLVQQHPAAHACYFEAAGWALHSLSPELFLHHRDGILTTEPIKGTRPRGSDAASDARNRRELLDSPKEQAELFMITDLLRNDLGKVSQVGSVVLDAIKEIRPLPRVWHTLSRLHGTLRSDLSAMDALISMFPGGSITGCPKKRAVEVIDELELSPRGIYTGAIGYLHPDGELSFNIAIRTLVQQGSQVSLGTGGGITIDSEWEAEWEELLVKASTFK